MKSILINKIVATEQQGSKGFLEEKGRIYTFLNPVSYLDALKHKEIFNQMDGIFADGSLLVGAIRLVYGEKVTRRSFDMTSMAPELLAYANEKGLSVCVVATRQEMMEKSVGIFAQRYPNIVWKGCRNGYFATRQEMADEARKITELAPDFLIVGMGILKQEEFLLMVKSAGYQGIGFTCGGFIHQTAHGETYYYPQWVDRMNIRFLYRMWKEPHTRKRYLMASLIFPAKFIWERFFG